MALQTPSQQEYNDALAITSAYEAAKRAEQEAARAAFAVPVRALVESSEFATVYAALKAMIATQADDSHFGIPVGALHTISKNLASQVGVDMDAPTIVESD